MGYRKNKQRVYDEAGTLTHKDCPRCHKLLTIDEFCISKRNVDDGGRSSVCRACTKRLADQRESPDTRKRLLLSRVKSSAKAKNIPFNLTLEDIVIPTHCPVLGIALEFGKSSSDAGWRENSPSLDRIYPAGGYTKGNVIVVSYRANRIKNDATVAELLSVADFYSKLGLNNFTYG